MYIFIDTNIYLDYYRMSTDTAVSLKRLIEHIKKNKKSKLILPDQTINEFYRNKNNVIAQSFKALDNAVDVLTSFSRIQTDDNIANDLKKFREKLKTVLTDKNSEINILIDSLFKLAEHYYDDDVFDKAYKRMIKRNPPGKIDSIGDALEWEILLNHCNNKHLYIITKDKDWSDEIEDKELKPFLMRDWDKVSRNKITLFKSIGDFLNKVYKAKISKDVIKEEEKISSKSNFLPMTHFNSEQIPSGIFLKDAGAWHTIPTEGTTKLSYTIPTGDLSFYNHQDDSVPYFYLDQQKDTIGYKTLSENSNSNEKKKPNKITKFGKFGKFK